MSCQNNVFLAPAKINLFLHVIGRRDDGYHLIQTVFCLIGLYDRLSFSIRSDGLIKRGANPPFIDPKHDLCIKAAKILQKESGCKSGVDIELMKVIPIGGGLGGGSSDAATTLMALNKLWRLDFPRSRLLNLALQVGADVPFFIFGRSAFAEGIGELLADISLDPKYYLLILPQQSVSTAEVFKSVELTPNRKAITIQRFLGGEATENDLEEIVCARYPEVRRGLQWLRNFGEARMTGAGGVVFCEFDSEQEAQNVLVRMPENMEGIVAKSLCVHPMLQQ